ncbi:glycosyltransferase family 28 C-terminal domain-containing protein [Zopfochytrium polystomum]|nr:glycosyltransferase family 28 C-terminal domain-containing protein [Zopfochytrium polystomum]
MDGCPECKSAATPTAASKLLFITVGTWFFEQLIVSTVGSPDFLARAALDHGFTHVLVQYGQTPIPSTMPADSSTRFAWRDAERAATKDVVGEIVATAPAEWGGGASEQVATRCQTLTITATAGEGGLTERHQQATIHVTIYALKPTIAPDLARAALVISHAGSGTIFGALGAGRPVIAVPNAELMHNHQKELADALAGEGAIVTCDVEGVLEAFRSRKWETLKSWEPGVPERFVEVAQELAGYR